MSSQVDISPLNLQQPSKLVRKDSFPLQTDLRKRLRELERQSSLLLANKRFSQASSLIEKILEGAKEYYKTMLSVSKDMQAIRTIHKLRKKEELILLHNQAVVSYIGNNMEQAIQQITIIIQQIGNTIQSQQTKYGFLQQSQLYQRKIIIHSINQWKTNLTRYYYFLAQITNRNSNREIALASLMKGLDLIKEIYKVELRELVELINQVKDKNETYAENLCHFQQNQQLYLLCELRDKVTYSKYLNIVSINTLIQTAAHAFNGEKINQPDSVQFERFQLDKFIELQLPPLEQINSNENASTSSINNFLFNKVGQLLYYDLICKIENQRKKDTNNDYERLKNAKNIILLHIFQRIICNYIPFCPKVHSILEQSSQMYKSKRHEKNINIYKLIDLFGLSPQSITEHSLDDISIIENNQHHKDNNKILKQPKINSKQKSKSKSVKKKSQGKGVGQQKVNKQVNRQAEKRIKQQKDRKDRIKNEYKLKDKKTYTKPEDHLIKAISQQYLTFDNSLAKDKDTPSPARKRSTRTQTQACIPNERDKIKKIKLIK